jgi:hypothetical protein
MADAPLRRHTAETLAEARKGSALLRLIADERVTHYVDAELPGDAIALMYVTVPRTDGTRSWPAPVHFGIHAPAAAREWAKGRRRRTGRVHTKLAFHGITAEQYLAEAGEGGDPELPPDPQTLQDATDAAVGLLFHHTKLINLDPNTGAYILSAIGEVVGQTMDLPVVIQSLGADWLVTTPIPGSSTTSIVPNATVQSTMSGSLKLALKATQADTNLEGQQWNYEYSSTSSDYGASAGAAMETRRIVDGGSDSSGDSWTARIVSATDGLSIDTSSIVYTAPTGADAWDGQGIWSANDAGTPLTPAIAQQLLAGNVTVSITTPNGALTAPLVAGPEADGLTPFTANFTGMAGTASGTFSLNSGGTGLTYTLSATGIGAGAGAQFVAGAASYEIALTNLAGMGQLSLNCTNSWLRHLSAYVQYLDVAGNAIIPPAWSAKFPAFLAGMFASDPTKEFVSLVGPVQTVFGVPLPADPTTISVPIWDEVHTVRFLWGGLGRGAYDSGVCPVGITVTALAELVLPVFLMALGSAVTNSGPVRALMADKEVLFAVCTAGAFLAGGAGAADIALAQDPGSAAEGLASKFGPMLLSPLTSLGLWVAKQIGIGAAERAVPFVDIALAVINAAVTAADLAETIIEVLDSPFVYETDVVRTLDLAIALTPDPRYNEFPNYHDHYQVSVVYDAGTTLPLFTQSVPPGPMAESLAVTFLNAPAGGNLQVFAQFFAPNGWQSGQGQSGWMAAESVNGTLSLSLSITTNVIPLNASSVYVHEQKLGLLDNGTLGWIAGTQPPTATIFTPSPFAGQGKDVTALVDITVAQAPEMIGYAWQSDGLNLPMNDPSTPPVTTSEYTVQNISVLLNAQGGYAFPPVGFSDQAAIGYDVASPDDGTGHNFFIDPTVGPFDPVNNPGGGYHLRQVSISHDGPAPSMAVQTNQSWGRFPTPLDRIVTHPLGYVFGIDFTTDKLYRVKLPAAAVADASAAFATMAAGTGVRDGLMQGPTGLAVALDGRLLVLEKTNARVQAFDIHGKPVPYFADPAGGSAKLSTMALQNAATATWFDLAVESQGYLYVLYYNNDGSLPADYCVDLYQPDGTFLVTTTGVTAGNIAVDILRNLWTLNYEVMLDSSGRPQPSVSMWLPPAPPPLPEATR